MRELILRAPLPTVQKHLLHVFLHHCRDKGVCWPSEKRLLAATGVRSRQTLYVHKKALRELGILDWTRPRGRENEYRSALYRLSWEALQDLVAKPLQGPSTGDRGPVTSCVSQVALAQGMAATAVTQEPATAVTQEPAATVAQGPAAETVGKELPAAEASIEVPTLAPEPAGGPLSGPAAEAVPWEKIEEPGNQEARCSGDAWLELEELFFEPHVEASTVLPAVEPVVDLFAEPIAYSPGLPAELPAAEPSGELAADFLGELLAVESFSEPFLGMPAEPAAVEPGAVEPGVVEPAAVEPVVAAPRAPERSGTFEVPLLLVWSLWREAYLEVYGRPYVQTAADRAASQEIARACAAAVLHREQRAGGSTGERTARAQEYLRHVFGAFLKRPGRKDFLRDRRHPLSLLPADLNALGEPWSAARKAPEQPAPLPPPLPREELLARCRELRNTLTTSRPAARPRILKRG